MKILVVNCGSSSIKYCLFDMSGESVLARGVVDSPGADGQLRHSVGGRTYDRSASGAGYAAGINLILDALVDPQAGGALDSVQQIAAVGHRVVHGGEDATESALIDEALLDIIARNAELAPLHNPRNIEGIEAIASALPGAPQVAVFDTAFLATLAPRAYRYAVPAQWYHRDKVRRYGFHGTSHRYVATAAAELLGKRPEEVNLITAHLGAGCSITAIAAGSAVDHSMGMTPLEGLVMATRCGDVDPAVVLHMLSRGLTAEQIGDALNNSSGLAGLSGVSGDMREILAVAGENPDAQLAIDVFVYRIAKYVGAYYTILPSVDALVLTGGIGENAPAVRGEICRSLASLGVAVDDGLNRKMVAGRAGRISADRSAPPVLVVPTNEELMIARDTADVVAASRR